MFLDRLPIQGQFGAGGFEVDTARALRGVILNVAALERVIIEGIEGLVRIQFSIILDDLRHDLRLLTLLFGLDRDHFNNLYDLTVSLLRRYPSTF